MAYGSILFGNRRITSYGPLKGRRRFPFPDGFLWRSTVAMLPACYGTLPQYMSVVWIMFNGLELFLIG